MELNETFNKAVEASRALNLTDVSRIDADFGNTRLDCTYGKSVIKMDIRNERNMYF